MLGRIAPPSHDELLAAFHEAGHAVFCQVLRSNNHFGRVAIWQSGDGWTGVVGPNDIGDAITYDDDEDLNLPPIDATMPYYWCEHAADAWATLLCAFAGSAADLVVGI